MFKLKAEYVEHSKFPILFGSLLIFFVGISLFDRENNQIIVNLLLTQIIFAGIYTVSKSKKIYLSAIFSGLIFISLRWAETIFTDHTDIYLSISILFMVFFMALVLKNILTYLLASSVVNTNLILGVISGYLLLGVVFSFVFSLIQVLSTESAIKFGYAPEFSDILYFTMITLTTIGYGDIAPVSDMARLMAYTLGVIGQMYMGIVMAFIIGKFLQSKPSTEKKT